MKFLKLVLIEIKNLLRSKFILIFAIVVLLAGIAIPIISVLTARDNEYDGGPIVYAEDMGYAKKSLVIGPDYYGEEPITIDGITINPDNPFYYNLLYLPDEKVNYEGQAGMFAHVETVDVILDIIDLEIDYYLRFATGITEQSDYRTDLAWMSMQRVYDKYIYEHSDMDQEILKEAFQYRGGIDTGIFDTKYVNITAEERSAALEEVNGYLDEIFNVVDNNDFPAYIDLRIQQEQVNIKSLEDQIAVQEQTIIDNPDQEDNINQYIEDLKKQINLIKTNTIPLLEYRLEKNIIPGDGSWQNTALFDIENNRNQLVYTIIVTEDEFIQDRYLAQQYKTYAKYKAAIQAQIDGCNKNILIAQQSLDADKPDMKFVPGGTRAQTITFLYYSVFVALFGVLVGGWLMANEFQSGTIRLLMIRPKTRFKILASKFLAALIVCLGIYFAGSLLNIVTNGICFGFGDLAFPNYSVSGQINFFAYFIPKMLACTVTIIFMFCFAFMLSVVIRNVAVSIALPIVGFVGSFIIMTVMAYSPSISWIAYTPIPYIQIASFFMEYSTTSIMEQNGISLNLTTGIIMLLALSAVFAFIAVWNFRKRDINN